MVANGAPKIPGKGKIVEVIDLNDSSKHCLSIEMSREIAYSTAGLIGPDLPFFCGGQEDSNPINTCYIIQKRKFQTVKIFP